ncbi:hypothetical protein [Helicobacter sp. MIT 05-5293]|uniref:hypothetical protein n=1 Tax=Helicobacter sp. MIT 05-5293 TaxID=1548149 RepID=UPI000A71624D|nr:hypothetical protein [Helicobacter sp. MIT 05-5293]
MKTREEMKALSFKEADKIENEVLEAIDDNDLAKVKDILKDYSAEINCYGEKIFKYKK